MKLVVAYCVLHNSPGITDRNEVWDEISSIDVVNLDIDE